MHDTADKRQPKLDRRSMLKGAGLAIGAAGATLAGAAEPAAAAADSKPTSGYRETDDVRAYYKAARF